MKKIDISDELFLRLQAQAEPLVDTIETVIERAVSSLEAGSSKAPSAPTGAVSTGKLISFDAFSPPDLKHALPKRIRIDGVVFKKNYWNALMIEMITRSAGKLPTIQAVKDEIYAPIQDGESHASGYYYAIGANI